MTAISSSKTLGDDANTKLTKRQRRKNGLNPSNTWQQHPGIKSTAARNRAYLIDAGLTKSKKIMNKDLLNPDLELDSPEVKIGRLLGSSDQKTRHKAVQKLESYLKARSDIGKLEGGFSELDLLKLWKGMWYTLYMADKVPVQDELSQRLAELMWALSGTEEEDEYAGQVYLDMDEKDQQDGKKQIESDAEGEAGEDDVTMEEIEKALEQQKEDGLDENEEQMEEGSVEEDNESNTDSEGESNALVKHCRGAHLVALYVRTFFRTVRREWPNMDKYRIDKFYTAIRFMMAQVYKYMAKRHWNLGIIRLFNDTIFEEVLSPSGTYDLSNGLRYHLIDITLQELAKANKDNDTLPLTEATFLDCLEPFFALAQSVDDTTVHKRVMTNIMDRFLLQYSVASDNMKMDESTEERKLVMDQVHVGSVAQFIFELASDERTSDRYRKALYDSHKSYLRRLKEVGRDVDLNEGEDAEEVEDSVDNCMQTSEASMDYLDGTEEKNIISEDDEIEMSESPSGSNTIEVEDKKVKKSKKKKKKKKKKDEGGHEDENNAFSTPSKESSKPQEKDVKHDSKKTEEEEEVITITKKQQKKAARAAKKASAQKEDDLSTPKSSPKGKSKKKRSPPSVNPHSMTDSDAVHSDVEKSMPNSKNDRRVKFGKVNYSKSYKASMRDLTTMEKPRYTSSRTPDKSILLCKRPSPIDEVALDKAKGKRPAKRKKGTKSDPDCVANRRSRRTNAGTRAKASDFF